MKMVIPNKMDIDEMKAFIYSVEQGEEVDVGNALGVLLLTMQNIIEDLMGLKFFIEDWGENDED